MRARLIFPLLIGLLSISVVQAGSEEVTVGERLARLEEGQKALRELTNKRFDDMNRRFEDMKGDTNRRFEDINRRFDDMNRRCDDLRFWLQIILGSLVVISGALVAQWFLMWKRIIGVESLVTERVMEMGPMRVDQRQEIEELRMRLGALEAKLAG